MSFFSSYKSYLGNSLTVRDNYYVLVDGKLSGAEAQSMLDDESSPHVSKLSSIMRRRSENLKQRYIVDKRRWESKARLRQPTEDADEEEEEVADSLYVPIDPGLRNWGIYCLQDGGGYGHVWVNNSCSTLFAADYAQYWVCDPSHVPTTVPTVAMNQYYFGDSGAFFVLCGAANWTLQEFQQEYGMEIGSVINGPASLDVLLGWGKKLFDLEHEFSTRFQWDATARIKIKSRKSRKAHYRHGRKRDATETKRGKAEVTAYTKLFL
jgi:hypothetical protein